MGISVAVIMKNEEANIYDFMASCIQFADEIVVNDTGSTDRSIDFIKKWPKVKLFQTKWEDDFSKARNFALSKCTQEWIIWLDLDDRVDAQNAHYIRAIAENADKNDVFMLNVKCKQHNTSQTTDIAQVRLFSKRSGVYFTRRIHESTEESIIANSLNKRYAHQVSIVHEGYADRELLIKKAKRNISILNKEEHSFNNYYDLGKSYAVLHKWLMAELFFKNAYELAINNEQKNLIAISMLNFLIEHKNLNKIDEWNDKLIGDSKAVVYYRAEIALLKQQYDKAKELFKEFLNKEKHDVQVIDFSDQREHRAQFLIDMIEDKQKVA